MTKKVDVVGSLGKKISAVIHTPKKDSGNLAVLCPGYLDTKDYPHLIKLAEDLSAAGYTAVRFDPTGIWESEGTIEDYLTSQYIKDVHDIVEFMHKNRQYKNVVICGHSRGGMVALLYAATDKRVTTVIGIMPSSKQSKKGFELWKEKGFRISSRDIPFKKEKQMFTVPFKHALDRSKHNVLQELKIIKAKVILIAGEKDRLVPHEDVREIFDKSNKPKKYFMMRGISHDYHKNETEIKKINYIIIRELKHS